MFRRHTRLITPSRISSSTDQLVCPQRLTQNPARYAAPRNCTQLFSFHAPARSLLHNGGGTPFQPKISQSFFFSKTCPPLPPSRCKFIRINTYRRISKQTTSTPLQSHSYEKHRGEGGTSRNPIKDFCPECFLCIPDASAGR